MNQYCCIQQNSFSASQEPRSSVNIPDTRDHLICPKPRRVGLFQSVNDPMRWLMSHQSEMCDSKQGSDLLDIIILAKGEKSRKNLSSPPPFFSGSPPSRVSNPLIKDEKFRNETVGPPISPKSVITSPSPSRKGGCVRGSFGNKPSVRIEGFDCLDRDNRRNCSIPTLA